MATCQNEECSNPYLYLWTWLFSSPRARYQIDVYYYGELKEILPTDAPEPLGEYATLIQFVDANLMHHMTTGKSITGILHLLNQTPIYWNSKKQPKVKIATYGSQFVAARTCIE